MSVVTTNVKSQTLRAILVVFPMLIAGWLYIAYRPNQTVFFRFFEALGLESSALNLRALSLQYFPELPSWVIYSLPGGLWLFAFLNSLMFFLKGRKTKEIVPVVTLAAMMGMGLEVLQYFKVTDGRFDWVDLFFYGLAVVASLYYYQKGPQKEAWKPIHWPKLGIAFAVFSGAIYLADIV